MRAAKYLGVPPWELMNQPVFWQRKALIAESAEIAATNEKQRRANDAK